MKPEFSIIKTVMLEELISSTNSEMEKMEKKKTRKPAFKVALTTLATFLADCSNNLVYLMGSVCCQATGYEPSCH